MSLTLTPHQHPRQPVEGNPAGCPNFTTGSVSPFGLSCLHTVRISFAGAIQGGKSGQVRMVAVLIQQDLSRSFHLTVLTLPQSKVDQFARHLREGLTLLTGDLRQSSMLPGR